jgi:hypothetical protein
MITIRKTGTLYELFVNGNATSNITNNIGAEQSTFFLGNQKPSAAFGFKGYLDEFGIWNRSLTNAEIVELYNQSYGLTYPFTSAPTNLNISLNITSPINIVYNTSNVTINFTGITLGTIDKLLYYNGSANVSYTTAVILTLNNGVYNFSFYANTTTGTENITWINFSVNIPPTNYTLTGAYLTIPSGSVIYTINPDSCNVANVTPLNFTWTGASIVPFLNYTYILDLIGTGSITIGSFDNQTLNYSIYDFCMEYPDSGLYYPRIITYINSSFYAVNQSLYTLEICRNSWVKNVLDCDNESSSRDYYYSDVNECPLA